MKFKITLPFMKIKDNENYMNFSPSYKLQKKTIYNTLSSIGTFQKQNFTKRY